MSTLIRSASLTNFTEIAHQCGLDPLRLVRAVGLPAMCLSDPDLKIDTNAVVRLLEMAAREAAEPAFGLRMGESRRLSNLGPLGLLLRDEPTLRHALDAIVRHIRVHNEALVIRLEIEDQLVLIREEFTVEPSESKRQATELAMAVIFRTLSVFIGLSWRPRLVCFTHSAPSKRSTHHRVFGEQVQFDHEFNALVCSLSDLDQPNPSADPVMARYAQELVTSKSVGAPSYTHQVQELILLLLPLGQCTADVVAQHMGCDRRTISRRLAAESCSFHVLVDEHRRQIVQQCLQEKSRPLSQVASLLGFSAPSAFSRWYRDQFGTRARDSLHHT
jgi:AraC-like DNA-binding protein